MEGAIASAARAKGSRVYSAKAEIDDFMRRFLAYAKTDNAAARAVPKLSLRDGALTAEDLKRALDTLDLLCARLDVESTNVIQIEIQNEALQSLHQDRMRRNADEKRALEAARLVADRHREALERRLRIAESVGPVARLRPAKVGRLLKRAERRARSRVRVATGTPPMASVDHPTLP